MTKTEWFPVDIKPVHEGWYECECCGYLYWWDKVDWRKSKGGEKTFTFGWRGLANNPKKGKK